MHYDHSIMYRYYLGGISGPFLTYKLGGANAPPPVPPCAPPRNHILPPQEKSLFPKIIQTNQRRITNR